MKWLNGSWDFLRKYPAKILQIYEKDRKKLLYLSFLNFIMMMGNTIGLSIATSLLIKKVGIGSIPSMYIANSLIIMIGSVLYLPFITKFKQTAILRKTFIVYAFLILAARMGIYFHLKWFYFILYLAALMFTWIYVTQFWTLATKICNIREGKRMFSLIVSAGLLGGGAGGLFTSKMVGFLHTDNMLFLWCIFFFVAAIMMRYLDKLLVLSSAYGKTGIAVKWKEDSLGILSKFRNTPLLKSIGASFLLYGIVVYILDFQFNYQLNRAFVMEDKLTLFYGNYYGYFYAGTLLIVIFIVSKLVKSIGVGNAMMTLPICVSVGYIFLNFNFGFIPIVGTKFVRDIIGNSIIESTYPLLFLPLAENFRREALTFNESFIIPFGMLISGLILMFLGPVLGTKGLVLLATALSVLWLYFSLRMKKEYTSTFVKTVEDRTYFERNDYLQEIEHLGAGRSIEILKQALNESNEKVSLFAVEMLGKMPGSAAHKILLDFIADKKIDGKFRASAILALGSSGDFANAHELMPYLKDGDPRVRANCIESIGRLDPALAKDITVEFLADSNPRVKTNAAVIQWKYGRRDEGLKILAEMIKDADSENRVRGVHAMGELGGRDIISFMGRLTGDPDENVRLYTVKALENAEGEERIHLLIKMLSDKKRKVRHAASTVLERINGKTPEFLMDALNKENALTRKEAAFILIKRKEKAAMPAILEYCRKEIEAVYFQIYKINKLEKSELLDKSTVLVKEIFGIIVNSAKLRCERKLFKVLRLLSAAEPSHTFTVAVRRLRDVNSSDGRANAIDIIEAVIGGKLVGLLIPLLEDTTIGEKADEAEKLWNFRDMTDMDILREMSGRNQMEGLRYCAGYVIDNLKKAA